MTALSGVRSSWLMLARNSLLCCDASASWRDFSAISANSRARRIALEQGATAVGACQRGRVGDDGVEHRRRVEAGADRAADLGQRAQLLDRAPERVGPLAQLADQPGILDRDHRLVRERPDELDL